MVLQKQVRDNRRKKSENIPHRLVNYKMQFHVLRTNMTAERAQCLMGISRYFEDATRLE